MQGSNRSGLQCLEHPNQQITNYCLHFDCLKPLCPDCVELHTKYHQKQQIESWKHCVNKSARNIKTTLDTLRGVYDKNNQYQSFKSIEVIESESMNYHYIDIKRLNQIKQKVMRLVDDVFNIHEQKLRNVIRTQYRIDPPDLTKLKMAIDELEKVLMKLGHASTVLPALKKSLLLDHDSLKNYFGGMEYRTKKTQLSQWYVMQSQDPIKLRSYIEDLVRINVGEIQKQHVISSSYNQELYGTPYNHRSPGPDRVMSGRGNQNGPIQINRRNYFNQSCQYKNLHFFIPSSNQLKILPLDNANNLDWRSFNFKAKQPLTCFFKSVVTPSGQIYLTGGSDSTFECILDQKRYREIYRYNYQKNSLEFVCKMINERSSHSICYQNGCIYLIGGFSRKDIIASQDCQLFRLSTQSCEAISALNAPSANSCAVPFGQNYIIKFGGGLNKGDESHLIEIYDIRGDRWNILNLDQRQNSMIESLSFSAGVQINETQVMIFGGYDNSSKQKPDRICFCLEIDTQQLRGYVKNFNQYPLPYAEGFWNNNPVIHNNKVYALQNITDQQDQLTALADERRLVIFNGNKWI